MKNDREGQLKIYQLFSPVLYGICLKYMKNEDDAKDVFQEAFVIVFKKSVNTNLKEVLKAG